MGKKQNFEAWLREYGARGVKRVLRSELPWLRRRKPSELK